ncbi:MAG: hypothetical protein A2925_04790 [Candidatus Yanofskybacteria bacterium RIFCSPLOWO2_01_FULL_44_22]|uniref:Uncharacterized protein n=2 Tax=Candidatus Yanofskyibacteriota TaxID=1752733 RepID=A0A1F8GN03_9BACT|nr:MAG: hypothetical protein A2925_04790 [Candidatus Yanofskybacteria bacterium RIFCSPLOWO2_01_FULL_44_22]
MPNQQLIDYINQSRQKGITDTQIRQELSAIGWSQSEIDEHLTVVPQKLKNWSDIPKKYYKGLLCLALAIVFLYFGYNFLFTIFVFFLIFAALRRMRQKQKNLQRILDNDNGIKKCPHCQMDISSLADKCPHCQSKIPKPRSQYDGVKLVVTAMAIVFGVFPLLFSFISFMSSPSEDGVNQQTPITQNISVVQKISLKEIVTNYDKYSHTEVITNGTVTDIFPMSLPDTDNFGNTIIITKDGYNGVIFKIGDTVFKDLKVGQVVEVNGTVRAWVGSNKVQINGLSVTITSQAPAPTSTVLPSNALPSDLRLYVNSVVALSCYDNYDNQNQVIWGSGVVIDNNGYILTNRHLTLDFNLRNCTIWLAPLNPDSSDSVFVQSKWRAVLISSLVDYDVAVLRIVKDAYGDNVNSATGLQSLIMSEDIPEIGSKVIAIGYPTASNNKFHITTGLVTGLPIVQNHEVIEINATTTPGNSGGALLDYKGRFIGIPTASYKNINGGYAIEVRSIKKWAQSVIQKTINLSSEQIINRTAETTVNPF